MVTLPDGDSVSLQHSDGFEDPADFGVLRWEEGFEDPIFIMGEMSITATPDKLIVGESVDVSGSATDTKGSVQPSAPYTVKLVDEGTTVASASGYTDGNGEFVETVEASTPGELACFAENNAPGLQHVEGFE